MHNRPHVQHPSHFHPPNKQTDTLISPTHPSLAPCCAGHSLGAALANLFSAAALLPLRAAYPPERQADIDAVRSQFGALITFAQPRVGGYRYAYLLEQALNSNGPVINEVMYPRCAAGWQAVEYVLLGASGSLLQCKV